MKYLFQGLLFVWALIIPVMASADPGHGLMGNEHYYAPIDLDQLIALAVVVLLAVGLKRFLGSRK